MNGWQRLGCVFIALWLVSWAGYGAYEWASLPKSTDPNLCWYRDNPPGLEFVAVGSEPGWDGSLCYKYIESEYWYLGVAPPIIGWLLVWLLVRTVQWVMVGFRPSTPKDDQYLTNDQSKTSASDKPAHG